MTCNIFLFEQFLNTLLKLQKIEMCDGDIAWYEYLKFRLLTQEITLLEFNLLPVT